MKKIIAVLTMIFMFGFIGTCFASPASNLLAKEEKVSIKIVETFSGNGQYASISKDFTKERLQKTDSLVFRKIKASVSKNFGKLKELKLVALEKFDKNDRLTYLASYTKAKVVKVVLVYNVNGKNVKLNDFAFTKLK